MRWSSRIVTWWRVCDLAKYGYSSVQVAARTGRRLLGGPFWSLSAYFLASRPVSGPIFASGGMIAVDLVPENGWETYLSPSGQLMALNRPPETASERILAGLAAHGYPYVWSGGPGGSGTGFSACATTTTPSSGSVNPEEASMAANHGPGHLSEAGFCHCGKACCIGDAGTCLCDLCACQVLPARPEPWTPAGPYKGPNTGLGKLPNSPVPTAEGRADTLYGPAMDPGDCSD